MQRTQIYLPDDLHQALKNEAKTRGVSFAHVVRLLISKEHLNEKGQKKQGKVLNKTAEGLLKIAGTTNKGPSDLGSRHDLYLYGFEK